MSLVGHKAKTHPQQGSKASVDDRETDPAFFANVDVFHHFTIDVAASAHNAKCERFFTVEDDGLAQSWAGETVWCNPPYSTLRPWVEKAWRECERADKIVMILPANRTEQRWWQELVEPWRGKLGFEVTFLPDRIRFIAPGATRIGKNERPPFGCCLLIWSVAKRPDDLVLEPEAMRLDRPPVSLDSGDGA